MSQPTTHITGPRVLRIDARAILDAGACSSGFGGGGREGGGASLLLEVLPPDRIGQDGFRLRTLAVGRTLEVLSHEAAKLETTRVIARPGAILIPGLVNAHTHLDLTHIGPRPHDPAAGFVPWIDMVRTSRYSDEDDIAASVRRGVDLSLAAGTVAIGDIAGAPAGRMSLVPWRTLRSTPLRGVSYIEFFGIGKTRDLRATGLECLISEVAHEACGFRAMRLGLQPHAPNTVSKHLYALAARLAMALPGAPTCTHLAETPEEHEFIATATGPQRELLERFGIWDESILTELGRGEHPVQHLREVLTEKRFAVAHVNDAPDPAIEILAQTQTRVVYCPRASAYFGAETHFGPHRYQDMLGAGIPVALGTDSLVNLPPEAGMLPSEHPSGRGMSILEEMRFLHARDRTDPVRLLRMATIHGATAFGLDPDAFTFTPGAPLAGLLAVGGGETAADPIRPGPIGEALMKEGQGVELLLM